MTLEQALDAAHVTGVAPPPTAPGEAHELTARELDVLRLLNDGVSDADIATELVVSRRTVHAHLRSIYRKLDVGSRFAAAQWASDHALAG